MKFEFNAIFTLILLVLTSCGSIITVSYHEPVNEARQEHVSESKTESASTKPSGCEGCLIVPKSGLNKDLRYGYYFDKKEGKCVRISYSTGTGCVPPPFETYDECTRCCGGG